MFFKAPKRQRVRLQNYDYSQEGLYFITLVCAQRASFFGRVDQEMVQLNDFGKIALRAWTETPVIRPNVGLGAFVIMSNHLHAIVSINTYKGERNKPRIGKFISPTQTIGAIVRGYKGAVTSRIKHYVREAEQDSSMNAPVNLIPEQGSIWQANYHEHIIKDELTFSKVSKYIWDNPKHWAVEQRSFE